ncbi:hypothetical protein BaRGS_00034563 [Batillaria attramentaria]|uniref:G-protein coupled receptors family 1 profile domain-containing protein n=1 Tax=Batillaria attramentaria TaxID=370345 RepID=A0ABD0JH16_9CAEN
MMWRPEASNSVARELNLVASRFLLSVLIVNAFTTTTSSTEFGTQTPRDNAEAYIDENDMAVESPSQTNEDSFSGRLLQTNYPSNFAIPVYGFLWNPVAFIVFLTNSLICIVLLKKHMRTATNVLLVAIAISDMLTGLFPVPVFIYFFATDRFWEFVPYEGCYAVEYLIAILPTVFHTASIWLTLGLGIQRYISVCHPFKARRLCTMKKTVQGILVTFTLAILSHLCRFFQEKTLRVERPSAVTPNKTVTSCNRVWADWATWNDDLYFNIYFWYRALMIQLIPCTTLSILTVLLIRSLRHAEKRRVELLQRNRERQSRLLSESASTTLMLVIVVCLFLLVEMPVGFFVSAMVVSNQYGYHIVDREILPIVSVFSNFLIILSYPLNLVVYCAMSKKFRDTFKRLFTRDTSPTAD